MTFHREETFWRLESMPRNVCTVDTGTKTHFIRMKYKKSICSTLKEYIAQRNNHKKATISYEHKKKHNLVVHTATVLRTDDDDDFGCCAFSQYTIQHNIPYKHTTSSKSVKVHIIKLCLSAEHTYVYNIHILIYNVI